MRLRSRITTDGLDRTPHRAFMRATGPDDADIASTMSADGLALLERACKPSVGACAGQFTANTMAMVAEALGLTVPNSAMVPGVYAERLAIARRAGEIVMDIVRRGGPLPRDLVTRP